MVDYTCNFELLDNGISDVCSVFVLCNQREEYDSGTPWASKHTACAKSSCYMLGHRWIAGSTYAIFDDRNGEYDPRNVWVN